MESKTNIHIDAAVMLPVGRTLQMGKYVVEKHLSSGGFGNTYIVVNTQFEERRALKEFFIKGINERDGNNTTVSVSNATNRPQFEAQREKFKKEARRLRRLSHPNIVHVDDLFDENGTTYYVMDYIEGGSLAERVKHHGSFSEKQVMQMLPSLLDALEYVHNQQMWHLDLKPGNILLNPQGQPVLIDFGASKQLGLSGGHSTSTGMTYTPGYAPSEQVDQNFERIGPWTDLYALGGTLYNLVSTQTPPSVSEIQENEAEAFQFPKSVSARMRQLVVWMMKPNRRLRPQSVADVREFLLKSDAELSKPNSDETIIGEKKTVQSNQSKGRKPWYQRLSSAQKMIAAFVFFGIIATASFFGFRGCSATSPDDEPNDTLGIYNHILDEKTTPHTPDKNDYNSATVTNRTYTSDLGSFTYTGEVDSQERPNGSGKAVFADGRSYTGPFVHGSFHGKDAVFRYGNGDVFEGEFRNNYFYYGRYTVKDDGSYFVGSFKDGQPDQGSWYDKNGNKLD